jgi:uncharacterized protein YxeA
MAKFRLYHYTTIDTLKKIVERQEIKTWEKVNGINIVPMGFLSWEKKYDCAITFDGAMRSDARIEINPKIHGIMKWNKVKSQARVPVEVMEFVDKMGAMQGGNPNNWYTCNRPLYSGTWLNIEVFQNGTWVKYTGPKGQSKNDRLNAYEIARAKELESEQAFQKSLRKPKNFYWA